MTPDTVPNLTECFVRRCFQ